MNGFTDLHSHFVYAVDDGARTRADMLAMLDAAYANGITALFATPHVTPGLEPFNFDAFYERLDDAREYCRIRGYSMKLYDGAEVFYTPALQRHALEHRLPTLADTDSVLVEFAPHIEYRELDAALSLLERGGYIPVMAHVERYNCFCRGKNALKLKEHHDVRYQVNANTVLTERGLLHSLKIRSWFLNELIDYVASDAHDVRRRPYLMKQAFAVLKRQYGEQYAQALTGMA